MRVCHRSEQLLPPSALEIVLDGLEDELAAAPFLTVDVPALAHCPLPTTPRLGSVSLLCHPALHLLLED